MEKGVVLGWVLDGQSNVIFTPADVTRLVDANVTTVRMEFRLAGHPAWDDTIVDAYTTVVQMITGAGLTPIGLVINDAVPGPNNQQRDWNMNASEQGGTDGDGSNTYQTAYATALRTLVQSFPRVVAWEIWNEPNAWTHQQSPAVYTGGTFMYPSCYARLLAAAASAARRVRPTLTLISGGLLALTQFGTDNEHSAALYLEHVFTAGGWTGGNAPVDAIGYHYYGDQGGAFVPQHLVWYLDDLYATLGRFDDPARRAPRPLYITEIGWKATDAVTTLEQASNLVGAFSVLQNDPRVRAAYWFKLQDSPGSPFGLYDSSGTERPARAALASL